MQQRHHTAGGDVGSPRRATDINALVVIGVWLPAAALLVVGGVLNRWGHLWLPLQAISSIEIGAGGAAGIVGAYLIWRGGQPWAASVFLYMSILTLGADAVQTWLLPNSDIVGSWAVVVLLLLYVPVAAIVWLVRHRHTRHNPPTPGTDGL